MEVREASSRDQGQMAEANFVHSRSHLCIRTKISLEEVCFVMGENQEVEACLTTSLSSRRAEIVTVRTLSFKHPRQRAKKIQPNHPAVMSHLRTDV